MGESAAIEAEEGEGVDPEALFGREWSRGQGRARVESERFTQTDKAH